MNEICHKYLNKENYYLVRNILQLKFHPKTLSFSCGGPQNAVALYMKRGLIKKLFQVYGLKMHLKTVK